MCKLFFWFLSIKNIHDAIPCNTEQCWAMLNNVEQCWAMLHNAEQFLKKILGTCSKWHSRGQSTFRHSWRLKFSKCWWGRNQFRWKRRCSQFFPMCRHFCFCWRNSDFYHDFGCGFDYHSVFVDANQKFGYQNQALFLKQSLQK